MTQARPETTIDDASEHQLARFDGEPWVVERIEIGADALSVRGWAFPPAQGAPRLAWNGRPFPHDEAFERPDVGRFFWQRVDAGRSGFFCSTPIPEEGVFVDGYVTLTCDTGFTLPLGLDLSMHLHAPAAEPPMPSDQQRFRVIGNDDEFGFRFSGATDYHRIAKAILAASGKRFNDFRNVLDWGVGCGRVARYATLDFPGNFTGCDIDEDNVRWCAQHLPGTYVTCGLRPPLPFPDASFDLVYGISIFTHMNAPMQDAWLSELRRVMSSGAYALVTIHGRTTIDYAGLAPEQYGALVERVERDGISFGSSNVQLDEAVDHEGEYVNVYHSIDYVQRHWGRWFEVVAILPGYHFTHDLVILKQRDA